MQRRKLGNTDLELTTVGLGTWAIGGGDWRFGWGPQDADDAVAAVIKAVDMGINWVDTAAVYGDGASEDLVGRALRELPRGQRPLVATKCSRIIRPDGSIDGVLKRESIIQECEASLKRLAVDAIDLYQLHWPIPEEDIEEGWQTLVELRQQGKVREIGVSNHSVDQLSRLVPIHPVASLQPPYSMIRREIEEGILSYCGQQDIGIICYSPMGKGLLTGNFTADRAAQLPDTDHRSRDPNFAPPRLTVNLKMVGQLQAVADQVECTMPQLSIAWTLRQPEVTSAIVGARKPSQIEETAPAADMELAREQIARIEAILVERESAIAEIEASQA